MTEISTSRLRLRPYNTTDHFTIIGQLVNWLHDPEVVRYSENRHKTHNARTQCEYIDGFLFPSLYRLITLHDDTLIGSISARVDHHNDIADVGILIGDKSEWGKGYGHEAWQAMMKYLFASKVRKVTGGAMSCNKSMVHIFIKNQMKLEGLLREHHLLNGKPIDVELWAKLNG